MSRIFWGVVTSAKKVIFFHRFVGLSASLLEKLWMYYHRIFCKDTPWDKKRLHFGGPLNQNLDTGIASHSLTLQNAALPVAVS